MKRFVLSFLLGATPAVFILVLRHPTSAPRSVPLQEPVVEHSPSPPDPKAFAAWQSARARSAADSLAFLETLDARGAAALLERADALDQSDERRSLCVEAFERWAEINRGAALEYADAKWPVLERIGIVRSTLLQWADEDIDACWEWVAKTEAKLDDTARRGPVWSSFLENLYKGRALSVPSPHEIDRTWRELERSSANLEEKNGFGAIIPREGVFSDPLTREPAGSMWTLVLAARAKHDWSGTLTRMLALPHINAPLMSQVAHDWLWHDMDAALLWASRLEDPGQQKHVFMAMSPSQNQGEGTEARFDRAAYFRKLAAYAPEQVSDGFGHWNPAEASQWLAESIDSLPNPDSARHSLATALVKVDINAAKAWAESISSELQRKLTTMYVAREWSRYEPWAAKAWATETLGWTEEECAERLY